MPAVLVAVAVVDSIGAPLTTVAGSLFTKPLMVNANDGMDCPSAMVTGLAVTVSGAVKMVNDDATEAAV